MKLYEINEQILALMDQVVVDEETGEPLCDIDSIADQIESLQMERKSILVYLAKLVLNYRAEKAAVKAEEDRLQKRRQVLENKEKRLMAILDRECGGEKTDLEVATVYYRASTKVNVTNDSAAIAWLQDNHDDCLHYQDPEISKNDVKRLLTAGAEIPGVELVNGVTCSLR